MPCYYNEHDPFAAAWLRELIKDGLIAEGEVDERDIQTVSADDVRGFDQCHWFAGIGGWSYALRLAGWPDDRPVWTGSCPCQPFSAAGARAGGHDPRDLWPAWGELIRLCRPAILFGEQVAAAVAHGWIDRVATDLEAEGYAVGAAILPAASVGAFHKRDRLWFVANCTLDESERTGARRSAGSEGRSESTTPLDGQDERRGFLQTLDTGADSLVAESDERGREGARLHVSERESRQAISGPAGTSGDECVADAISERHRQTPGTSRSTWNRIPGSCGNGQSDIWTDVVWLSCLDGKRRPTQPGLLPLAHGVPGRVGTLRGAGNAIVPQVAAAFITAYLEARGLT